MILVDVGNSHARAVRGELTGGRLVDAPEEILTCGTPADGAAARALAAEIADARREEEPVGATSVVPAVTAVLADAIAGLRHVDHTWDFPFDVAVDRPETVGSDRWCNMAAAVAADLQDAIVVDAGTATTIDVLAGGVFEGGLIAPGMAFAARKLQEQGARLWPVPFAEVALTPGRTTDQALAIGAFHVGCHGILGTVAALAEQFPAATIVATGGLSRFLTRPGWRVDVWWTMRGLARLMSS
jgi:type III pantothenate kinase